jgi:mannose-6-phosphate isomerase
MFLGIENTPRDYAWGSDGEISALLGVAPTGGPEAELWLGAHAGSPARIIDPVQVGGAHDLAELISASRSGGRLPFLLKVLAASAPLSLQAHPTLEQAQAGFARENALGVPLDAAERNYKDPYPKPEIIVAVSERFEALCGFRPVAETVSLLRELGVDDLAARLEAQPLRDVFEWLITRGDGVPSLTARVAALPAPGAPKTKEIRGENALPGTEAPQNGQDSFVLGDAVAGALDTVRRLSAAYPGDPGIVIALLINRVTLRRGEALSLPAGNIHAYLDGVGIELMTASDNVMRGGLTAKHVDVDELLAVLDFSTTPIPYLRPIPASGAQLYRPDGPGFALLRIDGPASHALAGPAIALCTAGALTVTGATSTTKLSRGDAVYVTPDEAHLAFAGEGEVFLATTA